MKWVFWLSVAFIAYVYVGYPVWLWVRARWWSRPVCSAAIFPSVSIVMAVHNEAQRLERKLHNLFALDYPPDRLEIIVVSDGSGDATNDILDGYSRERLRVVKNPEHRGKAVALNAGIREARGEIVVFVDARQQLEPPSLRLLVSNFADPDVGCVTGNLVLANGDQPSALEGVGFYWQYEKWVRKCQGMIDSMVGAFGPFYAVRRSLLVTLPEGTILDDLYLPLHVARQGYRCVFDPGARVREFLPRDNQGEFRRKVRTLAGNYQLLQLAPWLLGRENRVRFHFISHKLFRLWGPFFLVPLFASSWWLAEESFYLGLALLQSAFYVCAGLGLWLEVGPLRPVLGVPAAFCLLNAAAIIGLANFLFRRGPLWHVWIPANQTARGRRN